VEGETFILGGVEGETFILEGVEEKLLFLGKTNFHFLFPPYQGALGRSDIDFYQSCIKHRIKPP
jgi:hypothetical protein